MSAFYNASIRNLEYRLRKFKDELPLVLEDAVYASEEAIISAIAYDQLYKRGINGKGIKIADYKPYTEYTKRIKKLKGQPTTRVTLKNFGDFYQNMYVVFDDTYPGGFYITSSDWKTDELTAKYGPEIFRLTNENFTRIVKTHIRKKVQKLLRKRLGLK